LINLLLYLISPGFGSWIVKTFWCLVFLNYKWIIILDKSFLVLICLLLLLIGNRPNKMVTWYLLFFINSYSTTFNFDQLLCLHLFFLWIDAIVWKLLSFYNSEFLILFLSSIFIYILENNIVAYSEVTTLNRIPKVYISIIIKTLSVRMKRIIISWWTCWWLLLKCYFSISWFSLQYTFFILLKIWWWWLLTLLLVLKNSCNFNIILLIILVLLIDNIVFL